MSPLSAPVIPKPLTPLPNAPEGTPMNKRLDPKTLINPFVVPSPLSLLDVYNRVSDIELSGHRQRDLLSALRRVEGLTRTPLSALPADLKALRPVINAINPARHGLLPKT